MINVISSARYKIDRKSIKQVASDILSEIKFDNTYTLNIIFVGKNKMRQIAVTYKKEDVALPVLSFNMEKDLGEIFICYPQAVLLAAERDKKVSYILEYLIKHGVENLMN